MDKKVFEDRLDPELRSIVLVSPEFPFPADVARGWTSEEIMLLRQAPFVPPSSPDPRVKVTEQWIPGPAGAPDIRVLVYEPKQRDGRLPGILYLHGGGYIMQTPEQFDANCFRYVNQVNCVILSPDYRLAPEYPFPAGVEDCYASLEWFAAHAEELGVDAGRIAVGGASAGGGLTLAVCMMARDRHGPTITFQFPIYPTCDDRMITVSNKQMTDRRALTGEWVEAVWNTYLGEGHKTRDISPYGSPARAVDWSGLPPTYTFVGDLDPHRDETLDIVTKLAEAGVPVGLTLYAGCIHGFDLTVPQAAVSERATVASIQVLKYALWK